MVTQIINKRFEKGAVKFVASNPIQAWYVQTVKQKIAHGEFQLCETRCVCGWSEGVVISEVERYGIDMNSVLCSNCGTIRFDPYLNDGSISVFYENYYQCMYNRSSDEESYFSRQKMYGRKFLSVVQNSLPKHGLVVEIGCGAGGALKVFAEVGYQVAGCDYDFRLLEFGKKNGVDNLQHGSLKELKKVFLGSEKAVFIFMNHVFEHASDPEGLLLECKSFLNSNGKIIISVPDIMNVDKFDFFKGDILPMLHVAHKYNYSFQGLSILANRVGLQAKKICPDENIKTHTSIMPELWVEMSDQDVPEELTMEETGVMERLLYLERLYQKIGNGDLSSQQVFHKKKQSIFKRLMGMIK